MCAISDVADILSEAWTFRLGPHVPEETVRAEPRSKHSRAHASHSSALSPL